MFSITCDSCAARLKVKQTSAIGQVLACPKCGSMIKVVPPEDWSPDAVPDRSGQSEPVQRGGPPPSLNDIDFDDIEKLIRKEQKKGDNPNAPPPLERSSTRESHGGTTKPLLKQANENARAKANVNPADVPHSTSSKSSQTQPGTRPHGKRGKDDSENPNVKTAMDPTRKPASPSQLGNPYRLNTSASAEGKSPEVIDGQLWINPETQKRRRQLFIIAGSIAGLLVVLISGILIWQFVIKGPSGKLGQDLAENKSAATRDEVMEPSIPEKEPIATDPKNGVAGRPSDDAVESELNSSQSASTASPNVNAPGNLAGGEENGNEASSELNSPVVSGSPLPTGIPSLPTQGGDVPGLPLAGGLSSPPGLSNSVNETMPPALPNQTQDLSVAGSPLADQRMGSPLATRLPSQVAPSVVVDSRQYSNVLSELAPLISTFNTSLEELGTLTNSSSGVDIGLPILFVKKDKLPIRANTEHLGSVVIPRIQYHDVRLNQLMEELSQLINAPIAFDVEILASRQVNLKQLVSVDTERKTCIEVLNAVLEPYDLVSNVTEFGIEIQFPADKRLIEKRYKFPAIDGLDEEKRKKFGESVQKLLQPDSWLLPESGTSLAVEGEELVVTHERLVHRQITSLIDGMSAAYQQKLKQQPMNIEFSPLFRSADANLAAKSEMSRAVPNRLGLFLDGLQRTSQMNLVVDWRAIIEEGWSISTEIPGHAPFDSLAQGVDELTRAMGLTQVVINEHTLWLTTYVAENGMSDVEVYSIADIVSPTAKPEMIVSLLNQTVNSQPMLGPKQQADMLVYDSACEGLILVAPQSIQRQVDAVLNRLRQGVQTQGVQGGVDGK